MTTTLVSKPLLLATGLLTASLVFTGCSNNDSADVEATEDNSEQTVVANTNGPVEEAVAAKADGVVADDEPVSADQVADETSMPSSNINPATTTPDQPSLVTNPTEPNTPEDTVKQALNTLYYGDVEDAVGYYQVDMANFEQELGNTQSAFQQTVESVTITKTQYSVDNTKATITGELRLKGQSEPAPLTYQLRKVNGQWKILG
ncbi:hypothetical protein ACS8FD_02230 [Psychrobacter sp. 1U2]|uniref:hypothetical protein n=1 Tax=Psychrobacter sp. 1U2 TaxID=3453577 RepID=UPI003F470A64